MIRLPDAKTSAPRPFHKRIDKINHHGEHVAHEGTETWDDVIFEDQNQTCGKNPGRPQPTIDAKFFVHFVVK